MTKEKYEDAREIIENIGYCDRQIEAVKLLDQYSDFYEPKGHIVIHVPGHDSTVYVPKQLKGAVISMLIGCFEDLKQKAEEKLESL